MSFLKLKKVIIVFLIVNSFLSQSRGISVNPNSIENIEPVIMDWNLELINFTNVWKITNGSKEVTIAIIDSGIIWQDKLPESLRWENVFEINGTDGIDDDSNGYIDDYYGFDFVDNNNNTQQDSIYALPIHNHGTFLAGIIGKNSSSNQIESIAPNTTIMDLRVLSIFNSLTSQENLANAINYAIDKDASIINLSIEIYNELTEGLISSINNALEKGIQIVVSAGNLGGEKLNQLTLFDNVISVGSINQNLELSDFSPQNPFIKLIAPGEQIQSIDINGNDIILSGTSFSAAHVSGVIALMRSFNNTHLGYLKEVLYFASFDLGDINKDDKFGYGLLDAFNTVNIWEKFFVRDLDNDGLNNSKEIEYKTDPFDKDSDKDGLPDGWEIDFGLNPLIDDANEDPDEDKLTNLEEYNNYTNPIDKDTDKDGMPDGWEINFGLDPLKDDANEDPDEDELTNLEEYGNYTDPLDKDTDKDGMPDGWEIDFGLDPLEDDANEDPDEDGLINLEEYQKGSSPITSDHIEFEISLSNKSEFEIYSSLLSFMILSTMYMHIKKEKLRVF